MLLVVSLAYPLQRYLAQQAEIDRLEAENAAAQQRVEQLRTEVDLLDDPAYVQLQAQSRLQYVLPGDLLFVIDDNGQQQPVAAQDDAVAEDQSASQDSDGEGELPWFEGVLDSIEAVDGGR